MTYWVVAGLLALFNLYGGGVKIVRSRARLLPMMRWIDKTPMPVVRAIGAIEVLGAAGLILPPLTGIAPSLAFAAAAGFVVLQICAAGVHLARKENEVAMNVVLIVVAAVTAWLAMVWL